jgi:hypothetical protein
LIFEPLGCGLVWQAIQLWFVREQLRHVARLAHIALRAAEEQVAAGLAIEQLEESVAVDRFKFVPDLDSRFAFYGQPTDLRQSAPSFVGTDATPTADWRVETLQAPEERVDSETRDWRTQVPEEVSQVLRCSPHE